MLFEDPSLASFARPVRLETSACLHCHPPVSSLLQSLEEGRNGRVVEASHGLHGGKANKKLELRPAVRAIADHRRPPYCDSDSLIYADLWCERVSLTENFSMTTDSLDFMLPRLVGLVVGLMFVAAALQDSFEVVLLPRRVKRRFRFMHYFFRGTWAVWSRVGRRWPPGIEREGVLAIFGPLSMVLLFTCWAVGLVLGFGMVQWSLRSSNTAVALGSYLVMSGRTFFTLGSQVSPSRGFLGQALIIFEAGTGFGFIALMVSYLPVLYQHFSRRDAQIIELDARAGSPPEAGTLLLRYADLSNSHALERFLADWERWAADLAESHSAYPMLAFYRSQHHNNSWLASLTLVLDVSTLLLAGAENIDLLQAAACHAAARRVLIELTGALNVKPVESTARDRIMPSDLCKIAAFFQSAGIGWQDGDQSAVIGQLRLKYESMLEGLSAYLLLPLPQMGNFGLVPGKPTGRTDLIRRLVEPEAQVPIRQSRNRGELYARQDSRKPPHEQSR